MRFFEQARQGQQFIGGPGCLLGRLPCRRPPSRFLPLAEFRKRNDNWLMTIDEAWPWGPTNNFCKWFHVCEHESNHNGQIKLLAKRLPGAKPDNE